jgi:sugar/nucleoside kinase (ribokinase family)
VLVVGDLMVDVVAVHAQPIHPGSDTPAVIRPLGGGSAANTACWLAWLGRPVRLVAAVGDDPVGHAAVEELRTAGVGFAGELHPTRATGACVVLVDATGERTMLPDRGANDALRPATVAAALVERPAWLHLSGYTLLDAGSRPAGVAALAEARRLGVLTSVDASSAAPLIEVGAPAFLRWVEGIDVLFANEDELGALGGGAAAMAHVQQVVAKRGAAGSSWTDGSSRASAPALPVRLVDTVGAGDAFDAGFIDAAVRGVAPEAGLAAGSEVAARAVTRLGARPGGWDTPVRAHHPQG